MKIKITHLTSAHQRYDVRIFSKICLSLAKQDDYKVSLIVADGKGNEVKNDIEIIDVGNKSKSRLSRMTKIVKQIYEKARDINSDIYHFHDPELMIIGLLLKKLGKKVIYDIHENIDLQIMEKKWIPFILRKPLSYLYRKVEDFIARKFDMLIVPQEAMYKKYSKLNKTIVIANFPNDIKIMNIKRNNISKYNLMYSGSLTEARGLWNMLNLIKQLSLIDNRYILTIAGNIDKKLLEKAKEHEGWHNVKYLGFLSKDDIYKTYQQNSIGLILFNNVGQYFMAYSLKLFEYMQNGLFVVMPNFGDWIDFNDKYNVGINVSSKDSAKIAQLINSIKLEKMEEVSEHNTKIVEKFFSWKSQEKKLLEVYKEIENVDKI